MEGEGRRDEHGSQGSEGMAWRATKSPPFDRRRQAMRVVKATGRESRRLLNGIEKAGFRLQSVRFQRLLPLWDCERSFASDTFSLGRAS